MALAGRKFRVILIGMLVALLVVGGLAVPAGAQGTETCDDFATQEEAQAALDEGTGDPELLDENGDGLACNEVEPQSETCENPETVATFGPETEDQITDPFEITGDTFRISYEVKNQESAGAFDFPTLDITALDEDGFPVQFIFTTGVGEGSENVLAGPGTFTLEIEASDAVYTVTVEDCTEAGTGNGGGGGGGNGGGGGGVATGQYSQQQQQQQVINIPDKPLPNTGGFPPLLAIGFLLIAGAGLGTALLRRRF